MAEQKSTGGDAAGDAAPEYKGKVVLVSSEGDKFEVETKVAAMSELVKTMLKEEDDDSGDEDDADEQSSPLPNVKSSVLAKVVEFCIHHTNNGCVSFNLEHCHNIFAAIICTETVRTSANPSLQPLCTDKC